MDFMESRNDSEAVGNSSDGILIGGIKSRYQKLCQRDKKGTKGHPKKFTEFGHSLNVNGVNQLSPLVSLLPLWRVLHGFRDQREYI